MYLYFISSSLPPKGLFLMEFMGTKPVTLPFVRLHTLPIGRTRRTYWKDCRRHQQTAPRTIHLLQFRHRPEGGYSGSLHPRHNAMLSHRTFGSTDFTWTYPACTWCAPTARGRLEWSPTQVLTAPVAASLRWSYGNRHSQHDTPLGPCILFSF